MKTFFNIVTLAFLLTIFACEHEDPIVDSSHSEDAIESNAQQKGPWKTVFYDEFTGDLNNWQKTQRKDYNSSICNYRSDNPKLVTYDNRGCLRLRAYKHGNEYRSGHVKSNYSFKPWKNIEFRVRASIKLVAKSGSTYKGFGETYGAWPAFWTVQETNWPTKGEIDIMEGYSFGNYTKFSSNMFYGTSVGNNAIGNSALKEFSVGEGWHTYEMRWSNKNGKHTVRTYVDGNLKATYTNAIHDKLKIQNFGKHNIILNLNVGSDSNFGIFDNNEIDLFSETFMMVNYVKVERRTI